MLLVILLALLAVALFGLGFVIKWLFLAAVAVGLVLVVLLLFGGRRGSGRRAYW